MLVCVSFCALCTRDRGCSAHPVFPAPSAFVEGGTKRKTRARSAPRECGVASACCLTVESELHPPSSLRTQGPITTGRNCLMRSLISCLFQQQQPRSMGPCFRRDDAEK